MSRLTKLLGIDSAVVLGPFGGASSVPLVARVSDRGGLGSYGLYGYDAARIAATCAELRAATARPFALNLWVPTGHEVTPLSRPPAVSDAVAGFLAEVGAEAPVAPSAYLPDFLAQLDAALAERPAALSLVYGASAEIVDRAHAAGVAVVATATTVDEAVFLERMGVDAIVASGSEAAGHRVSFLEPAESSLVGTFALVPQVADAVSVPVLAAGGIADRRGVAAAFALGAQGVVVGTAFLRTREAGIASGYREAISESRAHDTVLTRAMSGRLARGLPNRALRELETEARILPFPAQNWLTGRFRIPASGLNRADLLSLWMGQAAALATRDTADEVFDELVAGLPN